MSKQIIAVTWFSSSKFALAFLLRSPFYLATLCPFLITCGLPLESFIIRPALKTVITVCQMQHREQWLMLYINTAIFFKLSTCTAEQFDYTTCTGNRRRQWDCITQQKGWTCPLGWPAKLQDRSWGKCWESWECCCSHSHREDFYLLLESYS